MDRAARAAFVEEVVSVVRVAVDAAEDDWQEEELDGEVG